ncbi:MAG TPA: metallophosphoesterase family protein [Anaeromyxobacter sp.]|nr:metallophosphoesterase family protein [Anaeromyxobacter sp.]
MLARPLLAAAALALATASYAAPSQVHLGWEGPTDTTMTVTWRSPDPTGQVIYGTSDAYGEVAAAASIAYGGSWLHEARLTGLSPGTTYHYRAGAGTDLGPDRTFTTAPARSARAAFRFAAYGDSRTDDAARARVRAGVQARRPAFSVDSGDLVENGNDQAMWDEWFATMEPLLATTPFVSVVGNHEVNSARFYQQFALPNRDGSPDTETYASWDYGNVHFLSLNTEIAYWAGSEQTQWLEADLAAASADPRVRWIVAVFHRPPYSSGSHGSNMSVREAWSALFEKYGVDVVFNGHDHHYERSLAFANGVPQRDGAGVVYVVTGGAGAPLYGVSRSDFTAFSRSVHHFVEVDVTPTTLSLEAIDDTGAVIDALTLRNDAPLPPDDGAGGSGGGSGSGGGGGAGVAPPVVNAGCGSAGGAASLASVLALVAAAAGRPRRRR